MRLLSWWRRGEAASEAPRRAWRASWQAAAEAHDTAALAALRAGLDALARETDDVEVEAEMLDALEQLAALRAAADAGPLPVITTHHRVVGAEPCHFTAPASLPDDPAAPSGRALFTAARAIFVGAGRTQPVAWHAVRRAVRAERDLLLGRADGSALRLRFNTYGDALAATFLARRLTGRAAARGL